MTAVASPTMLDAKFWQRFVRKSWNRAPVALEGVATPVLASSDEVMAGIRAACARMCRHQDVQIVFFAGNKRLVTGREAFAPTRRDRSLVGYLDRICDEIGGDVCLQIMNFQEYMGLEFWNRLRRILRGLFEASRCLPEKVEIELFAGKYKKTPVGVHLDSFDVFCFPVVGQKAMRVWSHSVFEEFGARPGFIDYEDHLAKSKLLAGGPGDVLFWPNRYWHIGESAGAETVASLSLGIAQGFGPGVGHAIDLLRMALRDDDAPGDNLLARLPFTTAVPSIPIARRLPQLIGKSLPRWWLQRVSGYAFNVLPEIPRLRLRRTDRVRADPQFPILSSRTGRELVLASCGRTLVVTYHPKIAAMVAWLNRGEPCSVRELETRFWRPAMARGLVIALLTELGSMGALRPV